MKSSKDPAVLAEVAGALWSLSETTENKVAIAQQSSIQPLVLVLGTGDERAVQHAAAALGSLALDNQENQVLMTQLLIELLSTGSEVAQERAATALWALVKDNPDAHEGIAKAGDPEKLVMLLGAPVQAAKDYGLW